ncbi:DNA-binding transcriptional regulator Fis [Candidatus Vondammii sp. HM_W22]|uniref:DNA-binding transcriptional regulator Fis n=1 Tax=Candidatus Vondammii sp. HM_W22 TaxID=2687299 RepID=UPI001F147C1B|nr:DNA-binding transcriptional regulator Fis [Candidatus Vondammii sp. HM_W22]
MTMEAAATEDEHPIKVTVDKSTEPLRECVRDALSTYFAQLNGHSAANLHQMVLAEVEQPLLETIMQHAEGNQTLAAKVLGISRSTLRKKLAHYQLD